MPFQLPRFATEAIANNPIVQLGKLGLNGVVRSEPFQQLRNAALDRTPLGLPEKTFIKAMTGGDRVTPGGIELSDDQLSRLKAAYQNQKDPARKPVVSEFDASDERFKGMSPEELQVEQDFYNENFRKYENDNLAKFNSPYVSTYSRSSNRKSPYGRDLKLTLGGLSMTKNPRGMRIQDRWDIDSASEVSADYTTGLKNTEDSFDSIQDLVEGGSIPSIIANTARTLGTYEPINMDQTVSTDRWTSLTPREATDEERTANAQGGGLQALNNLYDKYFK